MPRLPDKEALGNAPEIASRPMASISATPAPDGVMLGAVAGAVGQVGDTLTAIQLENKKKDDALDLVRAEAYLKGNLRDKENELRQDPDHATYQPRYITHGQEARDKASEFIKDPRTRAAWRAKADLEIEQGLARVNNYGYHRAGKEKEAQLETTLQGYQSQYANRDLDDAARASILKDMDQAVRLGEASGLIMPDHAKRLRDKYLGGTVVDEYDRQIIDGKARDVLNSLGWKQSAAPGSARAAQEEPGLAPGTAQGDLTGVLTSGKSKAPAAGWARSNETWNSLSPFEKAAAMSLMEADGKDPNDAKNALNAMINRAAKNGEDLGAHVSGKIYQPTIEASQERRLGDIVKSDKFRDLTSYAQARAAGKEQDTVNGATHFLAHEPTMERLTDREPGKYRSWPGWTGYDANGGKYGNPDGSEVIRDKSHAFLAPEGRFGGGKGKTADGEVEYSDLPPIDANTPQGRLTPHQRHALITRARNALRGDTLRALSDAEQTLYDTGKMPTDENGKTALDHAEGVLDPNQIEKARARIKLAGKVYEATTAVRDMSPAEADDHLNKFDPGQNPKIVDELGYADAKRVWDAGQKEKERTEKMREKDPAYAADQSREVADVLQRMQARNPELTVGIDKDGGVKAFSKDGRPVTSQDFNQELVRARLEAQDRYGIDPAKQRIVSRSDAQEILNPRSFKGVKSGDFRDTIMAAADRAEALYGRQYSERALQEAIGYAVKDQEHSDLAARIVRRMADGDFPKDDIEKYDALKRIPGLATSAGQSERAQSMFSASNGGMRRPTRTGDPARPAIDPAQMFNYSTMATGYAAEQGATPEMPERAPDKAAIEWLKRNPNRADEFDRQFGRFSAAKVLGNVK